MQLHYGQAHSTNSNCGYKQERASFPIKGVPVSSADHAESNWCKNIPTDNPCQ